MSRRSIDAAAEPDRPVAVQVWCKTCGGNNRKPLGEVRRSSVGLVFDAALPGAITWAPGQREALLETFRERGAGRLPLGVAQGRSVILVDDPEDTPRDEPAVECRGHRIELTRSELVEAAQRQTEASRPVKVVVEH